MFIIIPLVMDQVAKFQIAMILSLSNSFIMTKKAISIYCFIV